MRESRQVVWHKKHPDESHRGVRIRCSVDTSRLVSELDFLTFRNLWLLEEDLESDCRQECKDLGDDEDHRPVDNIRTIYDGGEAILQLSRKDGADVVSINERYHGKHRMCGTTEVLWCDTVDGEAVSKTHPKLTTNRKDDIRYVVVVGKKKKKRMSRW